MPAYQGRSPRVSSHNPSQTSLIPTKAWSQTLKTANQASKVRGARHPIAVVVVLAQLVASLVLDQIVWIPVDILHGKDHDNSVHRLGRPHRRHVYLDSSVLDLSNHPLREVAVGRGSGPGSPTQTMGEEDTD